MRRRGSRGFLCLLAMVTALPVRSLRSQEIVDRVVARVENDVILLSDIRELSCYQRFVDGQSETDGQILDRLIDQWIVRTEAEVAHAPHPSDTDIQKSLDRLRSSFSSEQDYQERKQQAGLSDLEISAMAAAQLYLGSYLDSRFRPAVQIESKAVEDFYQNAVVPRAKDRGQAPPTLEASRALIVEALIQQGINEQAERWLKESRLRLHIENLLEAGTK